MNEYVEQSIRQLEAADIAAGREPFRRACQQVSQCLEHCDMPQEQYDRALALLNEKEKLL